jgi:predicted DCC family thiol-disulfide oxidoreductase YuxK
VALPRTVGWNPLSCSGTALAPNVLLMAKLIAIALLLTNHVRLLPDPFLPFLPGLDTAVDGRLFHKTLQTVFVLSAASLIFNQWPRVSCLLLGGSMLLGVLASRAYYGNNKTFCALMLILAGLQARRAEPVLLRWQVALVYFGAALNKALDSDWQSGQFFDHWAGERLRQPLFLWLNPMLPPLLLGKLMCWTTIALEFGASVMLFVRRWNVWGACFSILLQAGILLFTGSTFTMFFYAMQAAMLVVLPWPERPMTVIWDGDCGFCAFSKKWISRFDFDRVFEWWPFQSGKGREHGISDQAAMERLQLVTVSGKVLDGFHAVRRMMVYMPVVWIAVCVLIAAAPEPSPVWRRVVVASTLFFFSPLMNRIGVAAYDWVARNRYRIFPNSTCAVPDKSRT